MDVTERDDYDTVPATAPPTHMLMVLQRNGHATFYRTREEMHRACRDWPDGMWETFVVQLDPGWKSQVEIETMLEEVNRNESRVRRQPT